MTLPRRDKVLAYVMHRRKLLVFTHPRFPEAGLQVPAGTLEPNETPEAGALREIREETGLVDLGRPALLGVYECDMRPWKEEIHVRRVFHVDAYGDLPREWTHMELDASDGSAAIEFRFMWADPFDAGLDLAGYQGDLLPVLRRRLADIPRGE